MRCLVSRLCRSYNWQPDNVVAAAAVTGLSGFERIWPLVLEGRDARGAGALARKTAGGKREVPGLPREKRQRQSDDDAHRKLVAFVEACGGHADLLTGWTTHTDERREGTTAGTFDTYFVPPRGPKCRSRADVARHLKLDYSKGQAFIQAEREAAKKAKVASPEKVGVTD